MSQTSSLQSLMSKPKDGHLLMGSYTLYVSQLMFMLTQESTDWKVLVSQVVVFICIILSREYKKRSSDMVDIGVGSDDGLGQNEPISH